MSIQRAIKNCRNCHMLSTNVFENSRYRADLQIVKTPEILRLSNEAMKALERLLKDPREGTKALFALEACSKCDHREPRIVKELGG